MKRLRSILVIIACSLTVAIAQQKVPRELQYGLIGGANLSEYRFAPSITQNQSQGYTFGVAARYIEEKIFGLQAELLLTRRGMKDRYDSYPQYSFERTLTYVEVPVMAHIYFGMGKRNEVSIDMGPKIGFFLSDNTTSKTDNDYIDLVINTSRHGYQHHDMNIAKKFDYGIQAGVGYEFKLNHSMSLQLQGRYYFGLGNVFPDTKSDVFENSSNQSIQIVAALWFHKWIKKSWGGYRPIK